MQFGRCDELSAVTPDRQPADFESQQIKRDDRQRIGVQRDEQCQGQVDAEQQGGHGGAEHLEGPGDQSAGESGRDCSCRAAAGKMPEVGMQQASRKRAQPTTLANRFMAGQESSKKFPHEAPSVGSILDHAGRASSWSGPILLAIGAGHSGINLLPMLPASWAPCWILSGVLAMVALALRRDHRVRGVLLVGVIFFLAAAAGGERATARLGAWLPEAHAGRDIVLVGRIEGLPRQRSYGERAVLRVERWEDGAGVGQPMPERILLTDYRDSSQTGVTAVEPRFRGGDRWRLTVRLKPPHGGVNPGGFDYEAWLLQRDIGATGYVRREPAAEYLGPASEWRSALDRLRESIRGRLRAILGDGVEAGVIIALAIGDQDSIDESAWDVFNRTGTTHLMAISGLHITLLAALVAALTGFAWRRIPRLVARVPARQIALSAGFVAALAYSALAGFGIPAQRTVLMLAVVVTALMTRRSVGSRRVLLLALTVVVATDPWAVLAPGFWLSFGTVAALLAVGDSLRQTVGQNKLRQALAGFGRTQWIATLATLPILAIAFHRLSVISPLANAIAIPLVGFVVAPLAIAAALIPIDFLAEVARWSLVPLLNFLSVLSETAWAVWYVPEIGWGSAVLGVVGVALAILPRGVALRGIAPFLFLPVVAPMVERPPDGAVSATVFDVGHGLSILLRTHEHNLLFDAGPAAEGRFDAGEQVVVPALRAYGVRKLDALVVSHEDSDHAGGVPAVLAEIPAAAIIDSLPDSHPIAEGMDRAISRRRCAAGDSWVWDGVRFTILHPFADDYADPRRKRNRLSCVLSVESSAGRRLLITADLEKGEEQRLLNVNPGGLPADVLLVPHQGSRTSSSEAFLSAVKPLQAVLPVGYLNRYGHPHAEVAERYADRNVVLLRTDRDGAIAIHLGQDAVLQGLRAQRPRYWSRGGTIAARTDPDLGAAE